MQKTAYEMRISDGSSDVCSSELFDELRHRYAQLRDQQWGGKGWYDPFFGAPFNNARLLPFGLYDDQIPAFEELFAESGRDWRRFFVAANRLAAMGADPRKIKLQQIQASASVRVSAISLKLNQDHVQNKAHLITQETAKTS